MSFRKHARSPASAVAAILVLAGALRPLAASAQNAPPPPAAPRSVTAPTPVEKTLPNGLRVLVVQRAEMPLVSFELMVRNGAEADPPRLAGLADVTASLLTKGTATRLATEIADAIESLGGSIESSAEWDRSNVGAVVLSSHAEAALAIVADVVRHPAFKDDEIERLRQRRLDDLRVEFSEPGSVARLVGARLVFGDAPYGHPASGTPESVAAMKRDDIVKLHAALYRPDNAILVVGGDIRPDAAFALAERAFGDWALSISKVENPTASTPTSGESRVVVIDKPDAGQAAVLVALPGIRRRHEARFSGLVANAVLSGYSGRLNQEVRIKRGLSYGARSALDARRDAGLYTAAAQTKNESAAVVADLLLTELDHLATNDLPDSELTARKATLIGGYSRSLETTNGLASRVAELALYGLPFDEINHYVDNVQSIVSTGVQQFAGSHFKPSSADVVIVGDAKQFLPELRKAHPKVEVIPIDALDLNDAALHKK